MSQKQETEGGLDFTSPRAMETTLQSPAAHFSGKTTDGVKIRKSKIGVPNTDYMNFRSSRVHIGKIFDEANSSAIELRQS